MRKLMLAVALLLSFNLVGCTATSALSTVASAVTGSGGGIAPQVGKNNTKQGIGATVATEDRNETSTEIKDSAVGAVESNKEKATHSQNIQTGSITAERIVVKNNDPLDQSISFGMGALVALIVMVVFGALLLHKTKDR